MKNTNGNLIGSDFGNFGNFWGTWNWPMLLSSFTIFIMLQVVCFGALALLFKTLKYSSNCFAHLVLVT